MAHKLIYNTLARADLLALYNYIDERNGPVIAGAYLDRIETLCTSLSTLPERGADRGDLGAGIRMIALERRVIIIYRPTTEVVEILRVIYAGRDVGPEDLPH